MPLSLFLYLEHWGAACPVFLLPAALGGLYLWTRLGVKEGALAGFFIGLLWFYWIGFSFRFTEFPWLTPVASVGVAAVYALLFAGVGALKKPWLRALAIFAAFDFIEPLGFTWFKPELVLSGSGLGTDKLSFALVMGAVLILGFPYKWRWAGLALVPFAWASPSPVPEPLPFTLHLEETRLPQEEKWKEENLPRIVADLLETIRTRREEGVEMLVLPESAFPLYLNIQPLLMERVKEAAGSMTVVAGALHYKGGKAYNSTYIFREGNVTVADKVVLVPFGEASPVPKWMGGWINDLFFEGVEDYQTAEKPTDFTVQGVTFRNAVCYEATAPELFEGEPERMVAISNQGWFYPSVEPTLQRLMMEHQARKHGTVIYHSVNMGPSEMMY